MMPQRAISERIDFSKSEQYTLSIRLSTDGFSFSIYDPIRTGSFGYFSYPVDSSLSLTANVKKAFAREAELLNHVYKRVNVLVVDKRFTLIPFELFEDEQAEELFYYNFSRRENEEILFNILGKSNLTVAFSIDKSVHGQLTEWFPQARFYSYMSPLIEQFTGKSRLGNSNKIYAYIHEGMLDVCVFERGKLQMANAYACRENADQLYYLLYAWKQAGFDQQRDELHLVGNLPRKEELTGELGKYIRQLFIINPQADFNRSDISRIEEIPFDLQSLIRCE